MDICSYPLLTLSRCGLVHLPTHRGKKISLNGCIVYIPFPKQHDLLSVQQRHFLLLSTFLSRAMPWTLTVWDRHTSHDMPQKVFILYSGPFLFKRENRYNSLSLGTRSTVKSIIVSTLNMWSGGDQSQRPSCSALVESHQSFHICQNFVVEMPIRFTRQRS